MPHLPKYTLIDSITYFFINNIYIRIIPAVEKQLFFDAASFGKILLEHIKIRH